jgi:hypothetical protein
VAVVERSTETDWAFLTVYDTETSKAVYETGFEFSPEIIGYLPPLEWLDNHSFLLYSIERVPIDIDKDEMRCSGRLVIMSGNQAVQTTIDNLYCITSTRVSPDKRRLLIQHEQPYSYEISVFNISSGAIIPIINSLDDEHIPLIYWQDENSLHVTVATISNDYLGSYFFLGRWLIRIP